MKLRCKTDWLETLKWLVGPPGFEPGTSCTPSKRASQAAPRPEMFSLPHSHIEAVANPPPTNDVGCPHDQRCPCNHLQQRCGAGSCVLSGRARVSVGRCRARLAD